jgi:hypothetical protein
MDTVFLLVETVVPASAWSVALVPDPFTKQLGPNPDHCGPLFDCDLEIGGHAHTAVPEPVSIDQRSQPPEAGARCLWLSEDRHSHETDDLEA